MQKAIFEVAELVPALKSLSNVVPKRATIPVLCHAHLAYSKGKATIKGTDLDVELTLPVPCETVSRASGKCLISPAVWMKAASGCSGTLEFTTEGELQTINCDHLTVKNREVCPVADYPGFLFVKKGSKEIVLPESAIVKALVATRQSISNEETRYYLNGLFFHRCRYRQRRVLSLVSTDGHRLTLYQVPGQRIDDIADFILPTKVVDLLIRLLRPGGNRAINLRQDANGTRVQFECEEFCLTAKTIDGTFPDFTLAIPTYEEPGIVATLGRVACARLAAFGTKNTPITIDGKKGVASMKDVNSGVELALPIQAKGEAPIGFQAQYLRDLTKQHGDIRLESNSPSDAALIVTEDPAVTAVLMPMRI